MRARVRLLLRVRVGMARQVVGVVGEEGAVRAAEELGGSAPTTNSRGRGRGQRRRKWWTAGGWSLVFGEQVQGAAAAHLRAKTNMLDGFIN